MKTSTIAILSIVILVALLPRTLHGQSIDILLSPRGTKLQLAEDIQIQATAKIGSLSLAVWGTAEMRDGEAAPMLVYQFLQGNQPVGGTRVFTSPAALPFRAVRVVAAGRWFYVIWFDRRDDGVRTYVRAIDTTGFAGPEIVLAEGGSISFGHIIAVERPLGATLVFHDTSASARTFEAVFEADGTLERDIRRLSDGRFMAIYTPRRPTANVIIDRGLNLPLIFDSVGSIAQIPSGKAKRFSSMFTIKGNGALMSIIDSTVQVFLLPLDDNPIRTVLVPWIALDSVHVPMIYCNDDFKLHVIYPGVRYIGAAPVAVEYSIRREQADGTFTSDWGGFDVAWASIAGGMEDTIVAWKVSVDTRRYCDEYYQQLWLSDFTYKNKSTGATERIVRTDSPIITRDGYWMRDSVACTLVGIHAVRQSDTMRSRVKFNTGAWVSLATEGAPGGDSFSDPKLAVTNGRVSASWKSNVRQPGIGRGLWPASADTASEFFSSLDVSSLSARLNVDGRNLGLDLHSAGDRFIAPATMLLRQSGELLPSLCIVPFTSADTGWITGPGMYLSDTAWKVTASYVVAEPRTGSIFLSYLQDVGRSNPFVGLHVLDSGLAEVWQNRRIEHFRDFRVLPIDQDHHIGFSGNRVVLSQRQSIVADWLFQPPGLRYRLGGNRVLISTQYLDGPDLQIYNIDSILMGVLPIATVPHPLIVHDKVAVAENPIDSSIAIVSTLQNKVLVKMFDKALRRLAPDQIITSLRMRTVEGATPAAVFVNDTLFVAWTDHGGEAPEIRGRALSRSEYLASVPEPVAGMRGTLTTFPNPASSAATLLLDRPAAHSHTVSIVNLHGIQVATYTVEQGMSSVVISTHMLPPGAYVVNAGPFGHTLLTVAR